MEAIKAELGRTWTIYLLSIPLDVITFLFIIVSSSSLAWRYLGEQWGKSPALLLATSGLLFALYYIFLRRVFLGSHVAALVYFIALSAATVFLPIAPVLIASVILIPLGAVVYSNYNHKGGIEIPVEKIYSNINGVYVQQFLANVESTFVAYRALFREGKVRGIPEMISAYPRRQLEHQLSESAVEAEIGSVLKETGLDVNIVKNHIHREIDAFLQTQRNTTIFGYEKMPIREIADEMEQKHPELYQYKPLHYEDLKKISEAEGLDVINLKDLEILAGLITYINTEGQKKYAILMRDDESEHQALKEFAMAHELGHWCAHIKGKQPDEIEELEFYLNALHDIGQFENEANKIALITLFPTSYLAQCEMNKTLNEESIFSDYIKGISDSEKRVPGKQLEENMRGFIKKRIANYQKHKYTWLQRTRWPDRPLPKQAVQHISDLVDKDFAWAELDAEYIVIDANEKFAELVGLTREKLIQMKINITELSEPESRHITSKQLEEKRKDLIPKFYVTRYMNLQTGEKRPVTIYALPIVDNDKYTGSLGIVTDVHRKLEASS
jgi:PAS domain S-box-containing protein